MVVLAAPPALMAYTNANWFALEALLAELMLDEEITLDELATEETTLDELDTEELEAGTELDDGSDPPFAKHEVIVADASAPLPKKPIFTELPGAIDVFQLSPTAV